MEIWQQILLGEENVRRQSSALKSDPGGIETSNIPTPSPQRSSQSFVFNRDNYQTSLAMIEVLHVTGKSGTIEDFLVKAPSSDYIIEFTVDGNKVDFRHTWDELYEMSQDIDSIVAVNRKGQYVASISDIHFTNKATIRIISTGIVFKKIFAKVRFNGQ